MASLPKPRTSAPPASRPFSVNSTPSARISQRLALSPLRPRSRAPPLPRLRRARFHAARRSGNPRPGPRGLPLRARTRRHRPGPQSPLPRRSGSREARPHRDRTWHPPHVRRSRRRETRRTHFRQIAERTALVLGAGTISEQVLATLRDRGIAHLFVMNRSRDRAEALAQQFGGTVIAWGDWDTALLSPTSSCPPFPPKSPFCRATFWKPPWPPAAIARSSSWISAFRAISNPRPPTSTMSTLQHGRPQRHRPAKPQRPRK